MEQDILYSNLLSEARTAYEAHPAMTGFAPFPGDICRQSIDPYHCPCADLFQAETDLATTRYSALQNAILAASPAAVWRETYKGTDIGADFMDRFGCYCIIGEGGPFVSDALRLYIVYMPAQLYYPWHHHPAEEIYLVISGSAVFNAEGQADKILFPGDTVLHKSNQPHATETRASPVLCLVAWRDRFDTPPVWSHM
ncbi:MAG: dimethylsulfonioproprionate lyase family protein [Arenibacterium sp.]